MKKQNKNIDWFIIIMPLLIIISLAFLLLLYPKESKDTIDRLQVVFVNEIGFFYILLGLFILGGCGFAAFSSIGTIRLGDIKKPTYSNFKWGAMIFTSTMAADILYWSLIEWGYYYNANPEGAIYVSRVQQHKWATSYPLFHWGAIPWAFYLLPAVAYAYMFFVKKRKRQTLSEACRPLLKKATNGSIGKIIDIFSVVGLLVGTATTFSLATPLLTQAISTLLEIDSSNKMTIGILFTIGTLFVLAVLFGIKGISKLAITCVILFVFLVGTFFFGGPTQFMIESGIMGIGNMIQNFFSMATWTDPLRATGDGILGFPQQWTIFYWAYWIAWFVATPFFIAKISEGRTIRQMILGGFGAGISGTFLSFIVFGNYGLYQQVSGKVDVALMLENGSAPASVIMKIIDQLPFSNFALFILVLTMISFYASTFDAITLIVAGFSTKELIGEEEPQKCLKIFWAIVFLILPVTLIFFESTLEMMQTLSIIAAFPLAIIMIIVVISFFKEVTDSLDNRKQ